MVEYTERRRLSDLVANRIREYVIQKDLRPGDRLPTELEFAQQFGVSRVSIREATKALGFLGFLEATPRRGTTVGQVNLRRVVQFLELHPALRDATAQQLIDSRLVIELGMLPYLYDRIQQDANVFNELNEFLNTFDRVDNLEEWLDLDREFHGKMMDASGLSPLFLFHELVAVFFARIQEQARNPQIAELLKTQLAGKSSSHRRVIEHLRDGQLDAALQELRAHVASYHEILEPPQR
jgi:DNA-binding FadR family transcriptional regulator